MLHQYPNKYAELFWKSIEMLKILGLGFFLFFTFGFQSYKLSFITLRFENVATLLPLDFNIFINFYA